MAFVHHSTKTVCSFVKNDNNVTSWCCKLWCTKHSIQHWHFI